MNEVDIHILLVDGIGIYIPKRFCQDFKEFLSDDLQEDWDICLKGPDNRDYWEAWDTILQNAQFVQDGVTWTLYQDGNLFAIPDTVEWSDEEEWFIPKEEGDA